MAPIEEGKDEAEDEDMGQTGAREEEVHGITARCPPTMREPHLPSKKEVEDHKRTHIPYRSWCKVCNEAECLERARTDVMPPIKRAKRLCPP